MERQLYIVHRKKFEGCKVQTLEYISDRIDETALLTSTRIPNPHHVQPDADDRILVGILIDISRKSELEDLIGTGRLVEVNVIEGFRNPQCASYIIWLTSDAEGMAVCNHFQKHQKPGWKSECQVGKCALMVISAPLNQTVEGGFTSAFSREFCESFKSSFSSEMRAACVLL